jgi:hypothetical protein
MSYSNEVGTAIPENVNLAKDKPSAVKSYSRRVKSNATNNSTFGEGQYVRIVVDTSVPGSFLDPLQSYLKFNITLTNTNPYIDYVSFGTCGVQSVIDEWRVYQQGTPIEEIINYNSAVEAMMDNSGLCIEDYCMFRSCDVRQKVNELNYINAIKPPMVSQNGNPMYYQAAFSNIFNQSSTWIQSTQNTAFPNNTYKPYLLGTQSAGISFHRFMAFTGNVQNTTMNSKSAVYNDAGCAFDVNDPTQIVHAPNFALGAPTVVGSNDSVSLTTGGVSINKYSNQATSILNSIFPTSVGDDFTTLAYGNITNQTGPVSGFGRYKRPIPLDIPSILLGRTGVTSDLSSTSGIGCFYNTPSGPKLADSLQLNGGLQPFSTTNKDATNCVDLNYFPLSYMLDRTDCQLISLNGQSPATSLYGSTIYFLQSSDYDPQNPLNWPFIMPHDNVKKSTPTVNLQNYLNCLCNVKNIPIGIIGSTRASNANISTYCGTDASNVKTNLNFQNVLPFTSGTQSLTTTVCCPLMSGIFGSLAEKAFPTMLCAPGSLAIEFKTASASKALQVSMDPCRRVLGTIRDYVPFGGSIGGLFGQFNYLNPFNTYNTTTVANTDNTTTIKSVSDLLLSNMTDLNYYGLAVSTAGGVPTTAPNIAQTPWTSNAYFGIGSGLIYSSGFGIDDVTTPYNRYIGPQWNQLIVTKRPISNGCFACIGPNLASFQNFLNPSSVGYSNTSYISGNGVGLNLNLDLVFSPYSIAAMQGDWTTYSVVSESSQIQGCYTFPFAFGGGSSEPINKGTTLTSMPGSLAYNHSLNNGIQLANTEGVPLPFFSSSCSGTSFATNQECAGSINMYTDSNLFPNSLGHNTFNASIISASGLPVGTYGLSQQCIKTLDDTLCVQYVGEQPDITYMTNTNVTGTAPTQIEPVSINMRGTRYATAKSSSNRPIVQTNINPTTVFSNFTTVPSTGESGINGYTVTGTGINPAGPSINAENLNPSYTAEVGDPFNNNVNPNTYTPQSTQDYTFCGHPSGIPLPQYIIVKTPWAKKNFFINMSTYSCYGDIINPTDLASESQACYGTYLDKSIEQSLRCFNSGNTDYVKYTISNVEFVSQQIILPMDVTNSIIKSAATQDISINTNFIRVYQSPINSSSSQNILIPAKVSSANAMYITFQPQNYLATIEGQLYNSLSRFCPFSQITSLDSYPQKSVNGAGNPVSLYAQQQSGTTQYAVGQSTPFNIINCPSSSGAFTVQLILGNELLPQQPMTSITELMSELLKTSHRLFDNSSNINAKFTLVPNSGFQSSSSYLFSSNTVTNYGDSSAASQYFYDCMEKNGFTTAFTFAPFLDDQTYIQNPNWNYVAACAWNCNATANTPASVSAADTGVYNIGLVGGNVSHGINDLFGARGPYTLPFFKPLESKFMIGFDLDTWSRISGVARSGRFLGNNTIQLQMTGATALSFNSTTSGLTGINMLSIIALDGRLSFQSGGGVVAYY